MNIGERYPWKFNIDIITAGHNYDHYPQAIALPNTIMIVVNSPGLERYRGISNDIEATITNDNIQHSLHRVVAVGNINIPVHLEDTDQPLKDQIFTANVIFGLNL